MPGLPGLFLGRAVQPRSAGLTDNHSHERRRETYEQETSAGLGGRALVVAAIAGGVAYATIPGSGNVYTACMVRVAARLVP